MAITGSIFSLRDVVNVFDDDIKPSSLLQAKVLTLQPATKNSLSSFSGSSDPYIITFTIVPSPLTGSSAVGTAVSTTDNAVALVQYRNINNASIFFTSSLINLSPSSSNLFIDLPDVTGSISDYEYRLIVLNGFNNDTSIVQSWQETGSFFISAPSIEPITFTQVTSSAYSTPNLFTEFVETNIQNLDLIEVESFISLYHSCPDSFINVTEKKRDFDPLYVKTYIPKGQTFANADYFLISSSLAGNLLPKELELRLGVGYYLKEKDSNSENLRYILHKFQPKPVLPNGAVNPDKYFILEPKSSTFQCSDSRIRYLPCVFGITDYNLTAYLEPQGAAKARVIYDKINSRIDALDSSLPNSEFPRTPAQDLNRYNISIPTSGLSYLYPKSSTPPNSTDNLGHYFISFLTSISGSLSSIENPSCELTNKFVYTTLTPGLSTKKIGIRNDPARRLRTIPLHEGHFTGSSAANIRFNKNLIPYSYPNPFFNGVEFFNYTPTYTLYNNHSYSYFTLTYPISVVEGFAYVNSGNPGENFCGTSLYTGSITSVASSDNNFKFLSCKSCSQETDFEFFGTFNNHKAYLGVYPLFNNKERTEGKIVDGGTSSSRCISASSYTKDSTGLLTIRYYGPFTKAKEFAYEIDDLKGDLKRNSVYVLQTTGSFLNDNKDQAKVVYVQKRDNQRILYPLGECKSCASLPSHPFGPEKFNILFAERYSTELVTKLNDVPYTSQIQLIHAGSDCCRQIDEIQVLEREITSNQSNTNPRYVP